MIDHNTRNTTNKLRLNPISSALFCFAVRNRKEPKKWGLTKVLCAPFDEIRNTSGDISSKYKWRH